MKKDSGNEGETECRFEVGFIDSVSLQRLCVAQSIVSQFPGASGTSTTHSLWLGTMGGIEAW